jgi:hypothetical protein
VNSYLDFDEFFYTVRNPNVLITIGRLLNHCLISRTHPAIFESLLIRFLVVEITQDDAWRSND